MSAPPPRLVPDRPSDAAIVAEFWKRWTSATIHLEAAHELQRIHDDAKAADAAAPPAEAPADDVERVCTAIARRRGFDWNDAAWQQTHRIEMDQLRADARAALHSLAEAPAERGDARAQFEAWAAPQHLRLTRRDFKGSDRIGEYCSYETQLAFEAFSAAMAAAPAAPATEHRAATDEEEAAIDKAVGLVKVVLRFPTLLHCTLTAEAEERGIAFPALIREKRTAPRVTGGREVEQP